MYLIVLYFLHSTSVLSFYIDVVLALSIAMHSKSIVKFDFEMDRARQVLCSSELQHESTYIRIKEWDVITHTCLHFNL